MRWTVIVTAVFAVHCGGGTQPAPDAGADAASDGASSDASIVCPGEPCAKGSFCFVQGSADAGACQPIPSFCKSDDVCTCNISFCTGGGGLEGCGSNTVYCP